MKPTEVITASEEEEESYILDAINSVETHVSACCGSPFFHHSRTCMECEEDALAEIANFRFPAPRRGSPEYRRWVERNMNDGEPTFRILYNHQILKPITTEVNA